MSFKKKVFETYDERETRLRIERRKEVVQRKVHGIFRGAKRSKLSKTMKLKMVLSNPKLKVKSKDLFSFFKKGKLKKKEKKKEYVRRNSFLDINDYLYLER